jgi:multiple sugar transport system permease protein
MSVNNALGKPKTKPPEIIAFIFLFIVAFIFLIPLFWIFVSAFKVDREVNQAGGFMLLPKTWTLVNFKTILDPTRQNLPIYRWFGNSLFISITHAVAAVTIYSMSAYAYAKLKFKGRDIIFITLLFLASFPSIVNIIPLYKLMLGFGWLNRAPALIVPGLAGVFNIFLIRQFMYSLPDSDLASARIDGAGEGRIFINIILPLIKPILTAVALFCFIGNWNDFLWPSIAMNNIEHLTLTTGLQLVRGGMAGVDTMSKLSSVCLVAIIPMIVLYLFTQRYFINGISVSSGVKG